MEFETERESRSREKSPPPTEHKRSSSVSELINAFDPSNAKDEPRSATQRKPSRTIQEIAERSREGKRDASTPISMKPAAMPSNAVPPNVKRPSEAANRFAGLRPVSLASGRLRRSPERAKSRSDIRFIPDMQATVEGTKVLNKFSYISGSDSC